MALEIFRLMGSVFVDTNKAMDSLHKVDKNAQGFGKTLLKGVGTAAKWAVGVAAAAGAAGIAIGTSAVKAYAEYEQLVGGIETLFGKSSDTVLKYANGAYKTAGMTANQYMETATSFAASLLAGLKGDTEAAARYTDMAITDMSDNANKMGTNMQLIQNAYQGFAKQNYSMLDNLKLGYGGTKKEMQRLLKDADAINKKQGKLTKYSIDNLNDVYEAIHVIQDEMGITGTTMKEASSTISGQIGMIKARFQNFKNTLGETLAPAVKNILSKVIDNFPTLESMIGGLATAVVKVVDKATPYLLDALGLIEKWFKKIPEIITKVKDKLTAFCEYLGQKLQPVLQAVRDWFGRMRDRAADLGGYLAEKLPPILKTLRDWFDKLLTAIGKLPEKIQAFKAKAGEVVDYISASFQPTLENLKKMFEAVKDKLQPFIDALADYIKSGEAAKDATEFLQKAGELLKEAFDLVAEAAGWVTEKVIEISDWCVEHYKTIESIAIVVGSFAAAWGLVNGALALWNGLATIGAAVTGALAGAGTVLAGVWAFLTAPITLVVLAIGAVIAIGVLLWRNWDTIKEKALELWGSLVDWFTQLKDSVVAKFTELKDSAVNKFNEMKDRVVEFATNLRDQAKEKFESMKSEISLAVSNAKQTVTDTFQQMYNSARDKVTSIYNAVKEKFTQVKTAIEDAITQAKNTVANVIEQIKNLFNFEMKLNLKLPHVSVYGGEAPWGIGGKGSLPHFDVQWYKKAMDNAMILEEPTLFGMNGAGQMLGAGEAGREVVAGENHLLDLIGGVVARQTAAQNEQVVSLLAAILEAISGGNEDVLQALREGHVLKVGEREFGRLVRTYA